MLKAMLETGVTSKTIKVALFAGAMLVVLSAQISLPPREVVIPRTVPWTDGKGVAIGTATFDGARMYLRNLKGEHVVTIVTDAHGSTMYDPSGNVLDHRGPGLPLPKP